MYKIVKACLVIALVCFCYTEALASFIQKDQVRQVVENWREMNPSPMNATMGVTIEDIRHYQGEPYGNPGYYVVFLNPNGWIIVPADDAFEPILAFGAGKMTREQFEVSSIRYLIRS